MILDRLLTSPRTNRFLDTMNDGFFRPRGLFCLVMTWNPESNEKYTEVDLNNTLASKMSSSSLTNKFRSSDGMTAGDLDFLEAAPLIFPGLDDLADNESGKDTAKKVGKLGNSKQFIEDYLDRRAQANYVSYSQHDPYSSMHSPDKVYGDVEQG